MTEYYNQVNSTLTKALQIGNYHRECRLLLLDHYESVIDDITDDWILTGTNSVQVNYQNGARRSCAVSVDNRSGKYTPRTDSPFWFNRKFKILTGIITGNNAYWFSQGVFVTTSATEIAGVLNITGGDKFVLLNGNLHLKVCSTGFTTDISKGDIKIRDIIRETLAQDMGNGLPLDPIAPIIDPQLISNNLEYDITLSAGDFYSKLILSIADMFGCDCYYDTEGRLNICKKCDYSAPSYWVHIGHTYDFDSNDITLTSNYSYDATNIVTVTTDNSNGKIYSATVKNQNAECPVNIASIGEHYPSTPTQLISIGDTTRLTGNEKCREYGYFLLFKSVMQSVSDSFPAEMIDYINAGDCIGIDDTDYVVQSIAYNLSANTMQITACNVAFLPTSHTLTDYAGGSNG